MQTSNSTPSGLCHSLESHRKGISRDRVKMVLRLELANGSQDNGVLYCILAPVRSTFTASKETCRHNKEVKFEARWLYILILLVISSNHTFPGGDVCSFSIILQYYFTVLFYRKKQHFR